jgi:23S rRNA (guanosine2251-2'-O)-methyltransferase
MGPRDGSDSVSDRIYGIHTVTEALRAGTRSFVKIVLTHRDRQFSKIIQLAKSQGIPLAIEPRQSLDRLVLRGENHQGVIGFVAAKAYETEEDILSRISQLDAPLFLALDGVEDPQNLGAIIRTAEAAGVDGIFIPERRSVGLTSTVARTSAGALEHMSVARCTNIGKLIERLQDQGISAVALHPGATQSYDELEMNGPIVLVFGGEGKGVRPGILQKCEQQAKISMRGKVESLNVSASVAVVLFEAVRQRKKALSQIPIESGSDPLESRH